MNLKDWKKGKVNEIEFWRLWLEKNGKKFEGSFRLSNLFNFMIGDKKEVLIANLGAGAINLIGDSRRDVKVRIISSDLLANEYKILYKNFGLKPHNKIEKQDMTNLTYRGNRFDIVFCANALDHCQDPYKALTEMVRVCKKGGWIYLRHIAHEGQRNHYHGLHKWNIDATEDGDCIFWDNDPRLKTNTFFLSEIYPGFTNQYKAMKKAAIITSFVQKT